MKRSVLNSILEGGIKFIDSMNFKLPPFAHLTPSQWEKAGHEYDEIRDNMLGWDITDFGSGDFFNVGLLLFTLRNGNADNEKYKKPYAEKVMVVEEQQVTPYHFHWHKMEDIINRGGGNLLIQLYNANESEKLADSKVTVCQDGRVYQDKAGCTVRLRPGESITLTQGLYHQFWAERGQGKVLLGEVSMVNDDKLDNRFLNEVGRFPQIEEDVPPFRLLAGEYPLIEDGHDE